MTPEWAVGGDPIDCYVLDTKQRVIALRSASKSSAPIGRVMENLCAELFGRGMSPK